MKNIQMLDAMIEECKRKAEAKEEVPTCKELGVNQTFYWAYKKSLAADKPMLDFGDIIWEYDVEEIKAACNAYGLTEFTISSKQSSVLEILDRFKRSGITLAGLTTTKDDYPHWSTGEHETIPAFHMMICE